MNAFLEWPCECRGTVVVRVGPEATEPGRPYVFSVTCKVSGDFFAEAIGVNAPAEGVLFCYVTAATRALRAAGLQLAWRRLNHDKKRDVISNRC